MCVANLLLSLSTALLGFIYKNSIEHQMAFVNRANKLLTSHDLEKFSIYTGDVFNVLCLTIILVVLGMFSKAFRFTHFLAGLALLVLNIVINFDIADPTGKYFLMLACLSIGLLVNGFR